VSQCSRKLVHLDFTQNVVSAYEVSSYLKSGEVINHYMTPRMVIWFPPFVTLDVVEWSQNVLEIAAIFYSCPRNTASYFVTSSH
jgi:hypothetical protein